MSDSDSDELLTRNIFTRHQNNSTMVSVAGPGVNFRYTGANFQPRYAKSSYNQQSRREDSPMSVRSVCDARHRMFNYSFNPNRMGAARSVYNGRAGSPMSVRSTGTSSSIADVITDALKHENFSKQELKKIKETYNKFIRHKVRKRIDKKRYRKQRRHRPRSGEDSGEQGSVSSISSGDRSTRTGNYNDNMSSARSAITDISTFRRTIKDSNMFKDCTESLRHKRKGPGSVNLNNTQMSMISNRSKLSGFNMPVFKIPANFHNNESKNTSVMLQKDRFTNGFLLPSQRFNKTGNTTMIPENVVHANTNRHIELPPVMGKESRRNIQTDSEEENIFSSHKPSGHINERKRSIDKDDDDIFLPNQKRQKPLSPCKNSIQAQKQKSNAANEDDNADDFIFAKPTFPVKKQVKEKLISKSAAPSLDTLVEDAINPPANMKPTQVQTVDEEKEQEESNAKQNTTNISMRPSFIKRKLFSQKLDVSEQRNHSTDSLDSPQTSMYGGIQKERKARKLQQATTQSCLNRDLQKDDNNLLDLIQKIVPMDKMSFTHNATNLTNKTDMQSKNLTEDNSEKWDVTSIISTHKNNSDVSDTFTDEEILNSTVLQKKEVSKKNAKVDEEKTVKEIILLKEKFIKVSASKSKETDTIEKGIRRDGVSKETVAKSKENKQQAPIIKNIFKQPSPKTKVCRILLENLPPNMNLQPNKHFWDTDSETEAESMPSPKHRNGNSKENLSTKTAGKQPKESPVKQGLFGTSNFKKPGSGCNTTLQNLTFGNTQKYNALTLKIKSHRAPTRNKFDRTTDQNTILTLREPLFTKQKDTTPKKDKKAHNGKKQVMKNIEPDSAKKIHTTNDSTKKRPRKVLNDDKVSHATESNNNINKRSENRKNKKSNAIKNYEQSKVDKNEKKKDEPKAKTKTSKDKNSKTRKAEMCITRNNSTLTEENNNRPIRSCRLNKSNISTDKSNASVNITTNRNNTLRSRKLHSSINENPNESKNLKKYNNTRDTKARLSDVSFSLSNDKNAVAKKALKKVAIFSPFKPDESDISFSLKDLSPSPRVTRSTSIIKNKNNVKESIFLRNSSPVKAYSLLKDKSIRNRVLNKRYLS